ncbi:MAG: DNA recombination protein RmuC [Prevotellaceae bacterium]|nr:DNA recombination protein RmuC [Candidatus Colivivens equi]
MIILLTAVLGVTLGVVIGVFVMNKLVIKPSEIRRKENLDSLETRHKENLKVQRESFDATMELVKAEMKEATETLLKQRQEEFTTSSHNNIANIVTPLQQSIKDMKEAMDKNSRSQLDLGGQMKSQIEQMINQSQATKLSADELARVFKHESKIQGDWGETILKELLDSQGLTQGIHYDTQYSIRDASGKVVKTDEGNILRPDVILHLDTRREVIIDSKVSLTAFMNYVNADNDLDKSKFLKAHIDSIERHVKELAVKDYSSYIQPPKVKMDYVLMFVPHAGALWTAINAQPDLWRKAMERNVYIIDEQSLFGAIKIINLMWTQIAQAENHKEVYRLADEILNRVGQFMKSMDNIGGALEKASQAYTDSINKLQDGKQSICTTCKQLEKLGAKQNKKNPITLNFQRTGAKFFTTKYTK